MVECDEERFLDLVSEASIDASLWPPVIERLADLVGGDSGFISTLNITTGEGAAQTARIDPAEEQRYFAYYAAKNPLQIVLDPDVYLESWRPIIVTDDDLMAKETLVRSEFYNDFMKPAGVHSSMMIRLAVNGHDVSAITLNRAKSRDRFEDAELALARRLHPHLIRAFKVGQRLAGADANGFPAMVLDRTRHAVILVDQDARISFINAAAERLVGERDGLVIAGGRLTAGNPDAARRLHQLIGQAASREVGRRGGGSMALPTAARRLPLSIAVTPICGERASGYGGQARAMVTVNDLEAELTVPVERLRDLFGLSRAEGRVAVAFAEGHSPKEAAVLLGLSFFTVRGHLVRIFEKTQTNRQAQLVRLLTRVGGSGID